jgi:DNA (cytosine-5)-methyltransferase 1
MPLIDFIDCFAGIGGFSLGLEWAGWRCVGQVEIAEYPRRVLQKHWPAVAKLGDMKKVAKYPWLLKKVAHETYRRLGGSDPAPIRALCGGYPCQPFSVAGRRRGAADDRHLWPCLFSVVRYWRDVGEPFDALLFENVAGHINLGLDDVLSDLESVGYAARPFVVPACAVDAPHRRDRVWIVAYSEESAFQSRLREGESAGERRGRSGDGCGQSRILADGDSVWEQQSEGGQPESRNRACDSGSDAAVLSDSDRDGLQNWLQKHGSWLEAAAAPAGETVARCGEAALGGGYLGNGTRQNAPGLRWPLEPAVDRMAHGVPHKVDRIVGLSQAVVPGLARMFGVAISAAFEEERAYA